MCGIWGYGSSKRNIDIEDAWRGLESLRNRGPDASGYYTEKDGLVKNTEPHSGGSRRIFIGNRRLSVIDPSSASNQPMERGGNVLVYNGEIYNYQELREGLRNLGYSFSSDSDTEVILAAYQEYGTNCVEMFEGMFAFVIYNKQKKEYILARDRIGIKPLYYMSTKTGLAFSSEVTALLESGFADRTLNNCAVKDYLRLGYVPGPETIIRNVKSIQPGSILIYDIESNETRTRNYWELNFGKEEPDIDNLRNVLEKSVKKRLRSDVPLGAFLSGGLDSSTIVGMMRMGRQDSVHTCSIDFEESEHSESKFASLVAEKFGTEHHSRTVGPDDVQEALPDIIAEMDQPSVDAVNTYFVSETAVDADLTVALSGLGGDELFFGYPTFKQVRQGYLISKLFNILPGFLSNPLQAALFHAGNAFGSKILLAVSDLIDAPTDFGSAYVAARGLFTRSTVSDLVEFPIEGRDLTDRIERSVAQTLDKEDVMAAVSHAEISWYMRDQLLRDTDTMSMAHSLEIRVPFLDSQLVETVTSIGSAHKAKGEKELLKEIVSDVVPSFVREREKTGFVFPFNRWLHRELSSIAHEALDEELISKTPLDSSSVRKVRKEFEEGDMHWEKLWSLVVLSLWIQEHINTEDYPDEQSNIT